MKRMGECRHASWELAEKKGGFARIDSGTSKPAHSTQLIGKKEHTLADSNSRIQTQMLPRALARSSI